MVPFKASVTGSMERNGRIRSIDVTARRYADGAYVACVRVPARGGSTLHTVEVSPREAATVRELMRDTTSQLHTALRGGSQRDTVGALDVVGHTYDVIGAIAPHSARPLVNASAFDIIGFDLNSLRRELAGRTSGFNANTLGSGAAQGALAGLATGGVEGAARGALGAIGGAMGLSPETAESIARGLAGVGPGEAEWQPRRDRALRELAQVIAAGTHPLGSANWLGAVRFHVGNAGITPQEGEELEVNQAALATFPRLTPYPFDRATGTFTGPGAASGGAGVAPAPAPAPLRVSARDALARATSSDALLPALMPAILPGVASVQVAPTVTVPAQTAGAALGASELLSRALAALALERGSSSRELSDAAAVASAALRSVDAIAGARAGDPRAKAAIRAAVNQGADRTARALRIGAALVGQ
jgi:hypothetical protein